MNIHDRTAWTTQSHYVPLVPLIWNFIRRWEKLYSINYQAATLKNIWYANPWSLCKSLKRQIAVCSYPRRLFSTWRELSFVRSRNTSDAHIGTRTHTQPRRLMGIIMPNGGTEGTPVYENYGRYFFHLVPSFTFPLLRSRVLFSSEMLQTQPWSFAAPSKGIKDALQSSRYRANIELLEIRVESSAITFRRKIERFSPELQSGGACREWRFFVGAPRRRIDREELLGTICSR